MRLSEVHFEALDVGVLVRGAHPCGGGYAEGGQPGVQKRTPSPPGASAV